MTLDIDDPLGADFALLVVGGLVDHGGGAGLLLMGYGGMLFCSVFPPYVTTNF